MLNFFKTCVVIFVTFLKSLSNSKLFNMRFYKTENNSQDLNGRPLMFNSNRPYQLYQSHSSSILFLISAQGSSDPCRIRWAIKDLRRSHVLPLPRLHSLPVVDSLPGTDRRHDNTKRWGSNFGGIYPPWFLGKSYPRHTSACVSLQGLGRNG